MNKYRLFGICALFLLASCMSQMPAKDGAPAYAQDGLSLDEALADIAAYYVENLPLNTKIALLNI